MKNIDPNTAADAIADFIAARGVTRCPAACATRTTASIPEADRHALAEHFAATETRRQAKIDRFRGVAGIAA